METYQARLRAKFQLSTTREVRHLAVRCYMAGLFRATQGKLDEAVRLYARVGKEYTGNE